MCVVEGRRNGEFDSLSMSEQLELEGENCSIQCDHCESWYHSFCVGFNSRAELPGEDVEWSCPLCAAPPPPQQQRGRGRGRGQQQQPQPQAALRAVERGAAAAAVAAAAAPQPVVTVTQSGRRSVNPGDISFETGRQILNASAPPSAPTDKKVSGGRGWGGLPAPGEPSADPDSDFDDDSDSGAADGRAGGGASGSWRRPGVPAQSRSARARAGVRVAGGAGGRA
eukprot:COSAG01_NODE_3725_length_5760_cov_46.275746_1_plen_224_part_10